jgi:hypothetical protein
MKTLTPGLVCESPLVKDCLQPCGELLKKAMAANDCPDNSTLLTFHKLDTLSDDERDELCDDIFFDLDGFCPDGFFFGLNDEGHIGVWEI